LLYVPLPPSSTLFPYTTSSDLPLDRLAVVTGNKIAVLHSREGNGGIPTLGPISLVDLHQIVRRAVERHRKPFGAAVRCWRLGLRSEEHTSELQSREKLVCYILL